MSVQETIKKMYDGLIRTGEICRNRDIDYTEGDDVVNSRGEKDVVIKIWTDCQGEAFEVQVSGDDAHWAPTLWRKL